MPPPDLSPTPSAPPSPSWLLYHIVTTISEPSTPPRPSPPFDDAPRHHGCNSRDHPHHHATATDAITPPSPPCLPTTYKGLCGFKPSSRERTKGVRLVVQENHKGVRLG
ncbi:hypothetical protein Tco_0603960 [Tanacetum coccineum]